MSKFILLFSVITFSVTSAKCQFSSYGFIGSFANGLASVESKGKYGFIDKAGTIAIPCIYENSSIHFSEGVAAAELNGKYGYIDKNGRVKIPFIYDYAGDFSEGLSAVRLNGLYGYIDKNNKIVVPFQFDTARDFSNGLAAVSTGKAGEVFNGSNCDGESGVSFLYGFINKSGRFVYSELFLSIVPPGKAECDGSAMTSFSDSVCFVNHLEYGWSIIDTKGRVRNIVGIVQDPSLYVYEFYRFSEGLYELNQNGRSGFMNTNLEVEIPCVFDNVLSFSEGLAAVEINEKFGFIDRSGKLVIAANYEVGYFPRFSEGLVWVKFNGKYGAINKEGAVIIPFEYDEVFSDFSDGLSKVLLNGKECFIDMDNKCVLNCN